MGSGASMKSGSRSKVFLVAAPLVVLLAALPFTGSACGGGTSNDARPDGGTLCQQGSSTCTAGTTCNNGNCVPTCDANGAGCPTGTFCEGTEFGRQVCAPSTFTTCTADINCPLPQFCRSGLCISVEVRRDGGFQGCLLGNAVDDACAGEAICLQSATSTTTLNNCIGMPACPPDGTCPVGTFGSVCNDLPDGGGRIFQNKQRVCLFSFCRADSNCPQGYACFRPSKDKLVAQCQTGTAGDLCFTQADCFNSNSCVGADGGLEDGGTFGHCQ